MEAASRYAAGWRAFEEGATFDESEHQDWKDGWLDNQYQAKYFHKEGTVFRPCVICTDLGIRFPKHATQQCPWRPAADAAWVLADRLIERAARGNDGAMSSND